MRQLSIPSVAESSHMPSLDGLRGIAILLVVLEHTSTNLFDPFTGNYGVYVFFVLSGFLITTLLLKEKVNTGNISLRNFYIRRFLRIFPVAYLYILVAFVVNFLFQLHEPGEAFLSAALYIRNTSIIEANAGLVGHYWTLSIEEQFYLIFPFFIWKNLKSYLALIVVLIAAIPVLSYLDIRHVINVPWYTHLMEILRYMPSLLIGSLLSLLMFYRVIVLPEKIPFRSLIVVIAFFTSWFLISQQHLLFSSAVTFTVAYVLLAVVIGLSLVPGSDPVYKILNSKVLTTVGVYSYSLYVWQHMFTIEKPWSGLFPGADSILLNWAALILVVYVSYNFYEKKFLNLKTKFK